jgi:hypothetical protein
MGRIPHSAGKASEVILWHMRMKQKMEFTLGDLIVAAYQPWGLGHPGKMVRLAINARLAAFQGHEQSLISAGEGERHE